MTKCIVSCSGEYHSIRGFDSSICTRSRRSQASVCTIREPAAFSTQRTTSASICYQDGDPSLVNILENARSKYADALINITNGAAWYRGSSKLDSASACGDYTQAVRTLPACRRRTARYPPGFNHRGAVGKSPKQQADSIIADIEPSGMRPVRATWRSAFRGTCLACCIILAAMGWNT